MVYEDAEKLYAEVAKDGKGLLEEAFKILLPDSMPLTPDMKLGAHCSLNQIVSVNTTPFHRREVVKIPLTGASASLKSVIAQVDADGKTGYAIMDNGILDSSVNNSVGHLHASGNPIPVYNECLIGLMPFSSLYQWLKPLCVAQFKRAADDL
jgi:alpha-mannosidase